MSEFEDIQRLIRLKRFEQPGEGFTEDFLRDFHQRQRADMLQQSSLELMWERTTTWWNNLLVPKWGMVGAAAAVCFMSICMVSQSRAKPAQQAAAPTATTVPLMEEKPFIPKMDLSDLPLTRMAERRDANLEDMLLRKHLEIRPSLEGTLAPIPAAGWQEPSSKNVMPIPPAAAESIDSSTGR